MKKIFLILSILLLQTVVYAQKNHFIDNNGLYGFKNKEGKIIIEPKYKEIIRKDTISNHVIVKLNDKYGLINCYTGKEVLPCKYDTLYFDLFYNNRFFYYTNGDFFAIDSLGRNDYFINEPYISKRNGKFGLVYQYNHDKTGVAEEKSIIKHDFDKMERIEIINNYLCYIVKKNGKMGIINSFGDVKIPLEYDKISVEELDNDMFFVNVEGKKKGIYYINGETIVYPMYDDAIFLRFKEFALTKLNGRYGLYTKRKELIKPIYDEVIYSITEPIIAFKKGNKWALYFLENNKLTSFNYDEIKSIKDGMATVLINKEIQTIMSENDVIK